MVYGVPMVVITFVSDQPVNARQVEKLGLGKVLDYKTITANAPGNLGAVKIVETYGENNDTKNKTFNFKRNDRR